jgi:hypothetical protein
MARAYDDSNDQYRQRGVVSKIGLALFVGLPSTMALAAALAVYCTFQLLKYSLSPKPKALKLPRGPASTEREEAFTATLSKMAEVHSPVVQIVEVHQQEVGSQLGQAETIELP